jgi:hypothetical protein
VPLEMKRNHQKNWNVTLEVSKPSSDLLTLLGLCFSPPTPILPLFLHLYLRALL